MSLFAPVAVVPPLQAIKARITVAIKSAKRLWTCYFAAEKQMRDQAVCAEANIRSCRVSCTRSESLTLPSHHRVRVCSAERVQAVSGAGDVEVEGEVLAHCQDV